MVIHNYRIVRQIGCGGCGVVYEAVHQHLGWRAAVKLLHNVDLDGGYQVERLLGEGLAAARIGHPGVVSILDYGFSRQGNAYLVMEYLEGQSLAARLQGASLPLEVALDVLAQVADAMEAAHRAGIIHRDLKPDNVFLLGDPTAPRIKVLDFGIAKSISDRRLHTAKTSDGMLLGTPFYMSPEQVQGAPTIDPRSDIYSLGCMLYRICCGHVPFVGTATDVLLGHLQRRPVRPARYGVAPPLEQLITQMLAKRPEDRPSSMAAVAARLRAIRAQLPWAFTPRAAFRLVPTVVRGRAVSVGPFSASAARRLRQARLLVIALGVGLFAAAVAALL